MNTTLTTSEMERAYLSRDSEYDGIFFVGVRTTGIFCRPVCPVRSPLPKNVEYFSSASSALFAGYRPCKRCRPLSTTNQPDWVDKLMSDIERNPCERIRERDLRERGIDPATVRRHFLRNYGMTFQAYARARRLSQAFTNIRNGSSLDGAVFESGYQSHSGFRDAFKRQFASTPCESRRRDCIVLDWIGSPLGPLVAGANENGICLLEFTDRRMLEKQMAITRRLFRVPLVAGANQHLRQLKGEIDEYFAGTRTKFTVPLVYPGTSFQLKVWSELLKVSYGQTLSYQKLAMAVGTPAAVRAVGRANGMNRIAIVIPCHRVVNKNGELGGYGGGLRRKQYLLNLERKTIGQLAAH